MVRVKALTDNTMRGQEIDKLIDRMHRNRLRESMLETWHHIDQWGLKSKGITARWLINSLDAEGYRVTTGYTITNVWGYHDRHILWK